MPKAKRWALRNAKKDRFSSSHRDSQLCQTSVRKLQRRHLSQLMSALTQNTDLFLTTLLSQSTISSTAKFQHIRADIKKTPASLHITTHGLFVRQLMQEKATRHSNTTQKLHLHSLRKHQTFTRLSHTYTAR